MQANARAISRPRMLNTKKMVSTAMLIALTIVMLNTPIGRLTLPIVSVTIAHIPILIAAITLGLVPGLIVASAFGLTSLFLALTQPVSLLDPFFVNPLVSVLPRVLIPVTTYFVYKGLMALMGKNRTGELVASGVAVAVGNLTNTFGVYTMLYLVYAQAIFEKTGNSALSLIVTAISTSTAIKCVVVVLITVPVVMALKRALKYR